VWKTTVNGKPLRFRLSGINNQNFIMRDEETGTWWQQVSGEAILGPLKGHKLERVPQDELTFAQWRREQPRGRVLRPDPSVKEYAGRDWEAQIAKYPTVTPLIDRRLEPRTLVVGVRVGEHAKAYPMSAIVKQSPIVDTIATTPVVIVLGEDKKSVRAFERGELELFAKPGTSHLVDTRTGSEWDFTGRAVSGPLAGKSLRKIEVLSDYWFDWRTYNPKTAVYTLGAR
jgi:Protein of unknown function (DUF3179)